jgi:hypothetical protein
MKKHNAGMQVVKRRRFLGSSKNFKNNTGKFRKRGSVKPDGLMALYFFILKILKLSSIFYFKDFIINYIDNFVIFGFLVIFDTSG